MSGLEALLAAALHPLDRVHLLEAALGLPGPAAAVHQAVVDEDPRLLPGQQVKIKYYGDSDLLYSRAEAVRLSNLVAPTLCGWPSL